MIKIVFFFIFSISLYASSMQVEKEIYKTILNAFFPQKEIVYVWSDNKKKIFLFQNIKGVEVVNNKKDADILIVNHTYNLEYKKETKIFADGYLFFKKSKEFIVGGFYWQKGRPNLVFIKKNLEKEKLLLPPDLQEYIEEDDF